MSSRVALASLIAAITSGCVTPPAIDGGVDAGNFDMPGPYAVAFSPTTCQGHAG